MAAASAGSQSGPSRNSGSAARDSNTPEASRYHGIVQFGVLSQHLAAVLGRDRNGLRRNPLAIATSLAGHGGAVTVAKTVQEAIRDLPRLYPNRTLRQRREHALQARQFGQRFRSQRIHLPRLPEVTQSPERFLTDRFLEAIRQQQSGQIAIEPPLAVGFDAPQQFRRGNPSFEKLEGRVSHRFIGGEVLRPDPGRLDELRWIGQAQPRTAQETVVDEERAGVVRCVRETVLMIGLHRTVHEADVVRDQFQVAMDRLADGSQAAKVPVDREALQHNGIRPEIFPEAGAPGGVHLGINPDSYLEFRETAFDQFQKKWSGYGDPPHAQVAQLGQQSRHPFLPWAGPFAVAEAGAVQEVIEGNAMTVEQADVTPQICFREGCR